MKIIQAVSGEPMFQDFRLVGGTALSLQLGHRESVDAAFVIPKESVHITAGFAPQLPSRRGQIPSE